MDILARHARAGELIDVDLPEIEVRPAARARGKPPGNGGGVVAGLTKGVHDLFADLTAARPKARADRGDEVGWPAPELPRHGAHTLDGG